MEVQNFLFSVVRFCDSHTFSFITKLHNILSSINAMVRFCLTFCFVVMVPIPFLNTIRS